MYGFDDYSVIEARAKSSLSVNCVEIYLIYTQSALWMWKVTEPKERLTTTWPSLQYSLSRHAAECKRFCHHLGPR
jgi:hypothetical protein